MSNFAGFQKVKFDRPKKSTFDLSHDKRITTRMGRLTPVLCLEAVPSDSFHGSSEMLVRLAPLLAPIYDQIQVFVHFYFVPNRLLWEDWEEFITGGRLGQQEFPPTPPYIDIGESITAFPSGFQPSQLLDYLGVPLLPIAPAVAADYNNLFLDAMPMAAYDLIWMEYYRDRNFVADDLAGFQFPLASGDVTGDVNIATKLRSYSHDYFTSALPFTQRGAEVLLPITGFGIPIYKDVSNVFHEDGTNPAGASINAGPSPNYNQIYTDGPAPTFTPTPSRIENLESVDLEGTTTTINDFRAAYALQVWLERNAVGGSRYTESTQAHFGVRPQDSRLQRPEYIGGGRIPVKISEVVSTAYSSDGEATIPLANMGGHGVTYGNTNQFNYFCFEHGFIMGILSIMSPPSYHQGLPKMFRRRSFLDYPWPTFAKLGEQIVEKAELYASPANLTEDENGELPLFGYQSRYADWKYVCNWNHGLFHTSLLFWTLTRDFDTPGPSLGDTFNEFDQTTQDRIFAVNGDEDNFWIYVHNKVTVKRPLPYFGTPNTLGFV